MPEIGTSGSMSGDGKRSVATWPKLPRPSFQFGTLLASLYHADSATSASWPCGGQSEQRAGRLAYSPNHVV